MHGVCCEGDSGFRFYSLEIPENKVDSSCCFALYLVLEAAGCVDWPRISWRRRLSWRSIRLWNSRQRCATVTPQTASTRCCSRQAAARTTPHAERDHAHARLLPPHGGPGGEQDADGSRRDESRSRALSVSSRRLCADETTTKNPHPLRIRSAEASQSGPAFGGDGAGRGAAPAMAPAQGTASANVGQAL